MVEPIDGSWVVVAYRSGEDIVSVLGDGPEPTLTVEGGHVSGTMGVNRLVGKLEGGALAGPLATTKMAGPQELMEQESILLAHLHDADDISVQEQGMTLSRDGLLLVELRRSGTKPTDSSS